MTRPPADWPLHHRSSCHHFDFLSFLQQTTDMDTRKQNPRNHSYWGLPRARLSRFIGASSLGRCSTRPAASEEILGIKRKRRGRGA